MSEFNPDTYLQAQQSQAPVTSQPESGGFDPDEFLKEAQEEKYGTTSQMAKTAVEGIAEGIAGPLAPLAETEILGVKPEDMRARKEVNPVTHGVGQAAGLGAGLLTGTGEGALMTKAGELGAEALGVGKLAAALPEASYGFKVGSSAVSNAAEMAVLQGSDEVSKMILQDPDASVQSAIANIGLSAALGGAGGALLTGAINPLWEATVGPKVSNMLDTLKSHIDGGMVLPEARDAAVKDLQIELDPMQRAIISGNPAAIESASKLSYAQNVKYQDMVNDLSTKVSKSVMDSMGIPLEEAQIYSKAEIGNLTEDTVKNEIKAKYEPFEAKYEQAKLENGKIEVSDESRLDSYGKLLEKGMNEVGTDSAAYKLYNDFGNRLLAKENIAGVDQLRSEIGNEMQKAYRAADYNTYNALKSIKNHMGDFSESQIAKQASVLETEGLTGAKKLSADMLNDRAELSRQYREFASMSEDLMDHLGIGHFKGAGTLLKKIESVGPETLLRKFSPKNNAEIIPFLQKYFPDTLKQVQKNELLDLIKPAISSAKGESPINVERLAKIINDKMAGKKELVDLTIPKDVQSKIESAKTIMDSIPKNRDSGTPGGLMKLLEDIPRSAMAGVAMITGHNPVMGGIIGEMAQRLGKDAPEALRLAHLKFLGSNQPIKSEGFKAMVDFMHNTYKGENMLAKATKNVLKAGAQVVASNNFPSNSDREKLDKIVSKTADNPQALVNAQSNSHLGHYLPNHEQAAVTAQTRAVQYLQGLKPHPHVLGPLDMTVSPQPVEIARYNKALDIAQNPTIVLQKVKDGTLQPSDIADLHGMYPDLYKSMSAKLSNAMQSHHADEEPIPYKTKMGMSLFLGQPLDVSMRPESIQAAQPIPSQPQQPQQGQKASKSMNSLGKSNKNYMTPNQTAEKDRSDRN